MKKPAKFKLCPKIADQDVIDVARETLQRAEAGELRSLTVIGQTADNEIYYGVAKDRRSDWHDLLGMIRLVEHELLKRWDESQ